MAKMQIFRLMAVAVMVVLIGTGSAWADLTDGLVAHWKLDGNANDSAGSNDGTLVNGPVWTTGQIDGALSFDGVDDYVDVPLTLNLSNAWTISIWLKSNEMTPGSPFNLGGSYYSGKISIESRDEYGYGGFRFRYAANGTGHVINTGIVNEGNWHHLVWYQEGGSINSAYAVYVDGQLVNETIVPQAKYATVPFRIAWGGSFGCYNGTIDDVRIYNRALSTEDIQTLMHTRPDTDDPTLVGYWDFDDGEGQQVTDSSLYGNHGRLGSTSAADNSDPNWVDSDAPVDICTLDGLVERNISNVLGIKAEILDLLDTALGKEDALLDYMDDAFHNGELDNLNKGDVVTAKQRIMGAIQKEEQAETAVDHSIDKLDDALNTLGLELNSQE